MTKHKFISLKIGHSFSYGYVFRHLCLLLSKKLICTFGVDRWVPKTYNAIFLSLRVLFGVQSSYHSVVALLSLFFFPAVLLLNFFPLQCSGIFKS